MAFSKYLELPLVSLNFAVKMKNRYSNILEKCPNNMETKYKREKKEFKQF